MRLRWAKSISTFFLSFIEIAYCLVFAMLAETSNKSVAKIAQELGIGSSTLYRWIGEFREVPAQNSTPHRLETSLEMSRQVPAVEFDSANTSVEETLRLRKEVSFLREENEILRRVALAFARTSYPIVE